MRTTPSTHPVYNSFPLAAAATAVTGYGWLSVRWQVRTRVSQTRAAPDFTRKWRMWLREKDVWWRHRKRYTQKGVWLRPGQGV